MLFQNFQSYQPVFEILLICLIAGIIGYLFHYIISRKKWEMRFRNYENKMHYFESRFRELQDVKDNQDSLAKYNKDMTFKINEFDALLGLDGKVKNISKTLNSLNFVSSKEFNTYVNEINENTAEYKDEVDSRFKALSFDTQFNDFESDVNSKFETFNTDYESKFSQLEDEQAGHREKFEESIDEKIKELEPKIDNNYELIQDLEQKSRNQDWKGDFSELSLAIGSQRKSFLSLQDELSDFKSINAEVDKNRKDIHQNDDYIADLRENYSLLEKQYDDLKSLQSKLNVNTKNISELYEMESTLTDLRKETSSYENLISKNRSSLDRFDQNFSEHKNKAREQASNHKSEIRKMNDQFSNLNSNIKSNTSSINKFEDKFSNLRSDIDHNKSKSKELFSKVIYFDEVSERNKNELQSLDNKYHKHQHDEYDFGYLKKDFENLQREVSRIDLDNKNQDELIDEMSKRKAPVKARAKVKAKAAPVVKIQARRKKSNKLVDNLSIKDIHASSKDKDDLKLIKGVGPFIEKKINKLGIYTFEQVSQLSKTDINLVTDAIQFFPGRIARDDWKGQAKKLFKKKLAS